MRKILISVAPVAATDALIDPKAVADDVIACAAAGAGMVHLHVRGLDGRLTPDLSVFIETVERIREKSDIMIEASTGGVSGMTIAERCAPLGYAAVEAASLNVGSVNLGRSVYVNAPDDVEYCVKSILDRRIIPEVEVFEIGMIDAAARLAEKFRFEFPLLFSIVLGHVGAAPATVEALFALRSFIPSGAVWGVTHANRRSFDVITAAIGMVAATVRVGFEDSRYIDETTTADRNAPLVERVARIVGAMGAAPATPGEARAMLRAAR